MDVAIELRHVNKRFGDVIAVNDVNLTIYRNEFFSILGPSGCGKTTTLRMLAGFEEPTSGEILINGKPVNGVPAFKREANMIFQHLALFPHMDVYDNIAFGLRMKGVPKADIKERVGRALDLVELPQMASRRVKQLSGGQQQRVAIARALVNEPAVLLLDEPLGALDLKLRQQMQVELKELQERIGTTFVYITHDQSEALTMSNRLGVMRGGKLEQIGTTEEVYEHPKTLFVANFIGDNNVLRGNVCAIEPAMIAIDCQGLVIQAERTKNAAVEKTITMGQSLALSIRPLRMQVGEQARGADNHFQGRILEASYTGDIIDYRVELPGGNLVSVKVVTSGQTKYGVGDSVDVGWSREHAVLVHPE